MTGASVEHAGMNIRTSATGEAFEEIAHEFGLQISYKSGANLGIHHGRGAAAKIDGRQPERFIHGHDKVPCPQNAAAVSQGLAEDFAQCDAYIFHCVVLIHIEVAGGCERKVESSVPREQLKHVVEKTNSRRDLISPSAFKGERNCNVGFCCFAVQLRFPHARTSRCSPSSMTTSRSDAINACV